MRQIEPENSDFHTQGPSRIDQLVEGWCQSPITLFSAKRSPWWLRKLSIKSLGEVSGCQGARSVLASCSSIYREWLASFAFGCWELPEDSPQGPGGQHLRRAGGSGEGSLGIAWVGWQPRCSRIRAKGPRAWTRRAGLPPFLPPRL